MSYSILDMGRDTRKQAIGGLRDAAAQEERREMQNEQIKTAERTQTMSSMGSGAMIGAQVAGPYGAAIGAAAGFVVGELF